MPDFNDELAEEIEEFDALDDVPEAIVKVSSVTSELDIAVAAWHEDGRWTLGLLPDPTDIAQIITSLKSQQTNGGKLVWNKGVMIKKVASLKQGVCPPKAKADKDPGITQVRSSDSTV